MANQPLILGKYRHVLLLKSECCSAHCFEILRTPDAEYLINNFRNYFGRHLRSKVASPRLFKFEMWNRFSEIEFFRHILQFTLSETPVCNGMQPSFVE